MQALASDDARGRGSATDDELAAGKYIAARLKSFGITPAVTMADSLPAKDSNNVRSMLLTLHL